MQFPLHSTFLALPLEDEAKRQFQSLQSSLADFDENLRFQNPDTPHLTLQYWKEVMEIEYGQIVKQAEKLAQQTLPFILAVTGASTFQNRVLYLDIAFSEELARLKKSCPWVYGKPFAPHITLARMRNPQKFSVQKKQIMKRLKDASLTISVDKLRLYAGIDGKKQTPIGEFVFGG